MKNGPRYTQEEPGLCVTRVHRTATATVTFCVAPSLAVWIPFT